MACGVGYRMVSWCCETGKDVAPGAARRVVDIEVTVRGEPRVEGQAEESLFVMLHVHQGLDVQEHTGGGHRLIVGKDQDAATLLGDHEAIEAIVRLLKVRGLVEDETKEHLAGFVDGLGRRRWRQG